MFQRNFFLALLITLCLLTVEARGRRKPIASDGQQAVSDATEKTESVPDQLALAASHTEVNQQRRGGAFSSDADENYPYSNLEMNLIRPESEAPVHTRITAKYRFSTKREPSVDKLEESETAAEYVSNAVHKNLYGTRLREPINIPAQSETSESSEEDQVKSNVGRGNSYKYFEAQQEEQQRKEQQEQEQEQQQAQVQAQAQAQAEAEQSHQQQLHTQAILEAQILAANQAYDAQTERNQYENISQEPAPAYEAQESGAVYENAQNVDRQYRTKYQLYQPYRDTEDRVRFVEDKLRVSASTEIPRADIMKQIEKSVIKYMKELEAEGKIIAAPPQEPKQYYHIVTVPTEEKVIHTSTSKPRSTTISYHGSRGAAAQKSAGNYHYRPSKHHAKSHYQNENEHNFQTSQSQQSAQTQPQVAEAAEQLAPNVEFIYKIKTRAPLQTATVKTVSKPYTLPLKSTTYEKFDHSAALKNMEEFDLSHVVTAAETDEHTQSGKPNKLYFNSEIYHDINSLPFKPEKALTIAEYRKLKSNYEHPEYKGYQTGYFVDAHSSGQQSDREQSAESTAADSDDGYPLVNPYKYVLKKEAAPVGLEDPHAVANWEQQRVHNAKAHFSAQKALEYDSYSPKFNNNPEGYGYQHSIKSVISSGEREHSNPKYLRGHALVKRGKRGNTHSHSHSHKKGKRSGSVKDVEANVALRPPPKL